MNYDVNKPQENPNSHVCGSCELGFPSEQAYIEHTCEVTGYTPADVEHQAAVNPSFKLASAAAQRR